VASGFHWLLIRRRITDGELAFYRCYSPTRVGLPALVRVAGTRWAVQCCFQNTKGAVGLDQHQVRRWESWHRYTTLVMLAHPILTVIAATERRRYPPGKPQLIALTVNEIRRLFAKLITNTARPAGFHLAWVTMAATPPSPRPSQPLPHPRLLPLVRGRALLT
jgi:hypothetical protein